jgi:WD40 repeat protein
MPLQIHNIGKLSLDKYGTAIAWNSTATMIATSEFSASVVKIWSFPQLQLLHTIDTKELGANQLFFTPDDRYLISPTLTPPAASFSIIDVNTGAIIRYVAGYSSQPIYPMDDLVQNSALTRDGKFLAATFRGDLYGVYIYNTDDWSIVQRLEATLAQIQGGPGVEQFTIIHDSVGRSGETAAQSYQSQNLIEIWDQSKRSYVFRSVFLKNVLFDPYSIDVDPVRCSFAIGSLHSSRKNSPSLPDVPWSYSTDTANAVRLWYPELGQIYSIPAQPAVSGIAIDDNENILALTSDDNSVNLVSLSSSKGSPEQELLLHKFRYDAESVSFSEDGKFLTILGDNSALIYAFSPRN